MTTIDSTTSTQPRPDGPGRCKARPPHEPVWLLEIADPRPEPFVYVTLRPKFVPETVSISDGTDVAQVRTERLPALIAALQEAQRLLAERADVVTTTAQALEVTSYGQVRA